MKPESLGEDIVEYLFESRPRVFAKCTRHERNARNKQIKFMGAEVMNLNTKSTTPLLRTTSPLTPHRLLAFFEE